jgi:RNA polymerase sigma-70 factor (ECF subfamily)
MFERHFAPLRWYAYRILNSEFWAEEVVQDVFVQLWIRREQLSEVTSPSVYLYRMTRNRCFDRIRRKQLEVEMEYVVSSVLHGNASTSQDSQYDLKRLEALIHNAIKELPEQRRKIYELQQEEGLSYQEIADRLQISRHTVRNQMAKTLQAIREYLLENGPLWLLLFSWWYKF